MTKKYIIASEKVWHDGMHLSLNQMNSGEFMHISNKQDLNIDNLRLINPEYIFFPHWSHLIPESIYSEFECVVFHMTDLPYGRGGSPLQNLIMEGIEDTKLTAIKVVKELDAGPVYMKRELSLSGSANDIFRRAASVVESMIREMTQKPCRPIPQVGEVTIFKRRAPWQSNLKEVSSKKVLFDMVRMLDADGYPHAFIEIDNFRIEFTQVAENNDGLSARAHFININDEVEL